MKYIEDYPDKIFPGDIVTLCMKHCREGFVVVKGRETQACNRTADRFLELSSAQDNLKTVLGAEQLETLLSEGALEKEVGGRYLYMNSFSIKKDSYIIIIHDASAEKNMRFELNNVQEINNELQHVFETYNDNTLYVCDSKGNTVWAGSDIAQNCGVTEEYLREHTAMELEKERVFYPSVAARVLKSGKAEIVTQITAIGKTGISIGIPAFDDQGKLSHIIALTRDLGYTLKLGQLLADLKNPKPKQEPEFVEMVACSPASIELMENVKSAAKVNVMVLIQAEPGGGKDTVANLIHKLGRRRLRKFEKFNCSEVSASWHERMLFGTNNSQGILQNVGDGILYIDEVQELSMKCQKRLLEYIRKKEKEEMGNGGRLIFSTSINLLEAIEEKKFIKELYQRISVVTLQIQPLRKRREDIPVLIKHFTMEANKKYQVEKGFSKEALLALELYSWPENVRELENTVERAVVISPTMLIEAEELPDKILEDLDTRQAGKKPSSLSEAVAILETGMIKNALEKYGTASLAAKALGVNQSTISRKMQKYGITGDMSEE